MTYYLLLSGDTDKDYHDTNVLGEESFGKFYTGNGFIALNNIINNEPELLQNIKIIDEQGKSYSITKFFDKIKKLKIVLD